MNVWNVKVFEKDFTNFVLYENVHASSYYDKVTITKQDGTEIYYSLRKVCKIESTPVKDEWV